MVFIWHVPEARVFPREGRSAVPPRGLTIFWCVYSRFSTFCLYVSCFLKLFAQLSLIRYVYNNPERRKRATIVCFLKKKILQDACADIFTRPTLLGFHAKGRNIVVLRFTGHRTIEMLKLVAPKVWPVLNCTQQVPTLLWFHANGRNKSQHCWAQQCCFHLYGAQHVLYCLEQVQLLSVDLVGLLAFLHILWKWESPLVDSSITDGSVLGLHPTTRWWFSKNVQPERSSPNDPVPYQLLFLLVSFMRGCEF